MSLVLESTFSMLGFIPFRQYFQDYAEGMNILALTLMVRCIINIKTLRTKGKQPA